MTLGRLQDLGVLPILLAAAVLLGCGNDSASVKCKREPNADACLACCTANGAKLGAFSNCDDQATDQPSECSCLGR